ncbi:MAG: hypothetical protein SGPRY_003182 [Prymnesium sp.]
MGIEIVCEQHQRSPLMRVDGCLLQPLPDDGKRAMNEVRRLIKATSSLAFFSELSRQLGSGFQRMHEVACAGMQPLLLEGGEVLFHSPQSLKKSFIVLSGEAALLTTQGETLALIRGGTMLSRSVLTWLAPACACAVASSSLALLELGSSDELKMHWLHTLHARAELLRSLPLLSRCEEAALRCLAFEGWSESIPGGGGVLVQGERCEGLTVLMEGSVNVSVLLGEGGKPGELRYSGEKRRAFLGALLGVIDLMQCALSPSIGQPELLDARHGACAISRGRCVCLRLPTQAVMTHLGEGVLTELADAAEARGSVREALIGESLRQEKNKVLRARVRESWADMLASDNMPADQIPPAADRRPHLNLSPFFCGYVMSRFDVRGVRLCPVKLPGVKSSCAVVAVARSLFLASSCPSIRQRNALGPFYGGALERQRYSTQRLNSTLSWLPRALTPSPLTTARRRKQQSHVISGLSNETEIEGREGKGGEDKSTQKQSADDAALGPHDPPHVLSEAYEWGVRCDQENKRSAKELNGLKSVLDDLVLQYPDTPRNVWFESFNSTRRH